MVLDSLQIAHLASLVQGDGGLLDLMEVAEGLSRHATEGLAEPRHERVVVAVLVDNGLHSICLHFLDNEAKLAVLEAPHQLLGFRLVVFRDGLRRHPFANRVGVLGKVLHQLCIRRLRLQLCLHDRPLLQAHAGRPRDGDRRRRRSVAGRDRLRTGYVDRKLLRRDGIFGLLRLLDGRLWRRRQLLLHLRLRRGRGRGLRRRFGSHSCARLSGVPAPGLAHRLAADLNGRVVLEEVLGLNPEDAVVGKLEVQGLLDRGVLLPHVALVAPVPRPLARAPRVPQLEHVPTGARDVELHGDDRVGMPLNDAEGADVLVAARVRGGAHEVVLRVVVCHHLDHVRPVLALVAAGAIGPRAVVVLVGCRVVRIAGREGRLDALPTATVQDVLVQVGGLCACEHAQGEDRVGSVNVCVGSGQLRDCLLEDAGPDLVILGEMCESWQAPGGHGDAVVHLHGHHLPLTEIEEADRVLSVNCEPVRCDHLAYHVGELAHGREGGQQPAVTQVALLQVARVHALNHVYVRELVTQALAAARARPA
mmetsp:Transcript_30965/g.92110  ORF Transcript_30965/g.92110 Transcript_30965/m.92110 type:complete len:534 (+) Transcript_30965:457-2058(+)